MCDDFVQVFKEQTVIFCFEFLAQVGVRDCEFQGCWGAVVFWYGLECVYVSLELQCFYETVSGGSVSLVLG